MDQSSPPNASDRVEYATLDDTDGEPLGFYTASAHHFAKIASSIFGIEFVMVAITSRKQGLHDRIAGTNVVWDK